MKNNKIASVLILITVFLIPFYFLRFKIGPLPTNIFEVAVFLSLILSAPTIIKENKIFSDWKIWMAPIILLLIVLFAALGSPDKEKALGIFKGWFFVPIIFSWLISKTFGGKNVNKLSIPIFCSMIVISVWGILQKVGLVHELFYQVGDNSFAQYFTEGRSFGPFESPNYLAMFLVPTMFLSLPLILFIKKKHAKIIFYFALILPALALLFSKSRAGLIAFAAAAIILLISNIRKIKIQYLSIVVVAVSVLLAAYYILLAGRAGSDSIRTEIYRYSYDLLKHNWFGGIGLGSFQDKIATISAGNYSFQEWGVPFALHPHNLYLAFWLYLGLPGIAAFFYITIALITRLCKQRNYIVLAALVSILAHGIFDTTYFKNDLAMIVWLIFAYSIAMTNNDKTDQ